MISLIIPVYNVELYLSQCLDSILNQTYSDFEVILINDGSKDNSGNICDKYAEVDSRVRVIHQSNYGVSTARNRGIMEARGEWIVFVDSDDFIAPDFLSNFHLEDNDSDIIIQGVELYHNQEGRYIKQVRVESKILDQENFKQSVENNKLLHLGYPVAKAYRKRLMLKNNIRFKTDISFHEDHIFVLEYLRIANVIQLTDSISYKYRVSHSNNSLSSQRHSWIMLNKAADQMLLCLDNMSERFLTRDSDYWRSIYTFAFSPKIESVNELFRINTDSISLKKNFYVIINRRKLRVTYKPQDIKHKLIKFIFVFMPYFVIVLFMRILTKWQNRIVG